MKKKLSIILIFILVLSLAGCSNPLASLREFFNKKAEVYEQPVEEEKEEKEDLSEVALKQPEGSIATVLYYKDYENLLVPVMRYIPKGDLGLAKAAVKGIIYSPELMDNLKSTGLLPTLPQGTKINGATIKDGGLAIIDFSEEFLNFDTAEGEALGVKALVYTLTEFSNIDSVQIRVDGETIEQMNFGTKIGEPLKRTEINLVKPKNLSDKLSKVMVYYQKKGRGDYSYFVPLTKLVSGYKSSVEAAINVLLEGPDESTGLQNPFPKGTKLLDAKVKDDTAFVNFSQEILNTDSPAEERTIVKLLTLTLKELPGIQKVRIFINGQTIEDAENIGSDEYIDVPVFVNFYE